MCRKVTIRERITEIPAVYLLPQVATQLMQASLILDLIHRSISVAETLPVHFLWC